VNALATIAAAVCLRTPRTGIRSSVPCWLAVATAFRSSPGAAAGYPERTVASPAACCRSSRVTDPSGPLPVSADRSTPRSLASRRTGGFASARGASGGGGPGWAGVPFRGGGGPGWAAVLSGGTSPPGPPWGIAGDGGYDPGRVGGFLRARRLVDPGLTPLATRTACRPGGASAPASGTAPPGSVAPGSVAACTAACAAAASVVAGSVVAG